MFCGQSLGWCFMKGQDILLLIKLASLDYSREHNCDGIELNENFYGWKRDDTNVLLTHNEIKLKENKEFEYRYTARGLAEELGISKSEVSNILARCTNVKLAKINRLTKKPEVNKKALIEFITHGLKYVFPAKPAEITRGIPTTFSAPVLRDKLLSAGQFQLVWPDSRGKEMGQSVEPIYKSVPFAVKEDPELYSYLALIDAIRMGNVRESNLACKLLEERLAK